MDTLPPFPEDMDGAFDDSALSRPDWSSESELFNDPIPEHWLDPPEFEPPEWSSGWDDQFEDKPWDWEDPPEEWDDEADPEGWDPDSVHEGPPPDGPKDKWEYRGTFSGKDDVQNYIDTIPFLDVWLHRTGDGWYDVYIWADTK